MDQTIADAVDTFVRYQTPEDYMLTLAILGLLFCTIFTFLLNKKGANDTNKKRGAKGEEIQAYGKDFLGGGVCNVVLGAVLAVYGPGLILGFLNQAAAPLGVYAFLAIAIGVLWGIFGRMVFNIAVDLIRDKVKLAPFRGSNSASTDQSATTSGTTTTKKKEE